MRTIYTLKRVKILNISLIIFSALLIVGCSGYQSVSYYEDGIYGETPKPQPPQEVVIPQQSVPQEQNGTYYKNYFADKASEGVPNDYIFTTSEQYQNPTPKQTSAGSYKAHGSWGDQVARVNVNIINNRPIGWDWGWGWYNAPFAFGRSGFWGYNYHPWYFSFDNFYNPYYNPYRWGYRFPYWNNWNRWGNPYPYYNSYWNRNYNRNTFRNLPTYTRLNGGRGQSSLSRTSRNANTQGTSVNGVQPNTTTSSLRNNMRRRSRNNNSYQTPSNSSQQNNTTTRRSRSNSNNDSYSASNSYSRDSYSNTQSSSNFGRTRSSSNASYSRTSAGNRNSSGGSSRSSTSRRR